MASTQTSNLDKLAIDRTAPSASLRRRRPLWKRWWFWFLIVLVVAAIAAAVAASRRPAEVEIGAVVAAYPTQSLTTLNATGRVTAQVRASVSSKGTGRLEWLGVVEGQAVKQGEIIARLENRDVAASRDQAAANIKAAQANLGQAQAELVDAEQALKRARELAQKSFIADSAVDTAEARFNKARAAIDTQRAQIAVAQANYRAAEVTFEQTMIRAPFTGIVLTKTANVGDVVTPFSAASGTTGAVVTMADMGTLEVEADVSENAIAKIKLEQPAEIQLDAFPELRLLGSVSRIVPTVDRSKATLLVKVRFDETDARVLPDMSAKIAFLSRKPEANERKPVAAVRPAAIAKRDGRDVVYVVRGANGGKGAGAPTAGGPAEAKGETKGAAGGGRVSVTPVSVGAAVGELVRVEGVAPGTRVIIAPPAKLDEGVVVSAAKK
jgi:RND family efflux transporter MFP subunit